MSCFGDAALVREHACIHFYIFFSEKEKYIISTKIVTHITITINVKITTV